MSAAEDVFPDSGWATPDDDATGGFLNIDWPRVASRAATALGVLVVAYVAWRILSNPKLDWATIREYLFSHVILIGVKTTIYLALVSQVIATVVGLVFALMRRSRSRFLRSLSWAYIVSFRATPLLVQILVWYNLAYFFPRLSLGLPFTGLAVSGDTNHLISATMASLLGLGLNEGAYMAEIIRGGIEAVPVSQLEAGMSLGMTRQKALRRIVLPQAFRISLPPTGNQFINLLKATSLVSVVGGGDLLTRAEYVYQANFLVLPLLIVASIWYLILTAVATLLQRALERRLDHEPSLLSRWRERWRPERPVEVGA